jgi:hypothetical protein
MSECVDLECHGYIHAADTYKKKGCFPQFCGKSATAQEGVLSMDGCYELNPGCQPKKTTAASYYVSKSIEVPRTKKWWMTNGYKI